MNKRSKKMDLDVWREVVACEVNDNVGCLLWAGKQWRRTKKGRCYYCEKTIDRGDLAVALYDNPKHPDFICQMSYMVLHPVCYDEIRFSRGRG